VLFFALFILGFISMGFTITHLHAATHYGWLRNPGTAISLGLYGWSHLMHHRDIPHEVPIVEDRQGFISYSLHGKGREHVVWVWKNLWSHERWTPIRIVIVFRAVRICLVIACAMILTDHEQNVIISAVLACLSYILGAACLMFCYDIWHLWTHVNGPYVSHFHAKHHGAQRKWLGMWWWNHIRAPKTSKLLRATMFDIKLGEWLIRSCCTRLYQRWTARSTRLREEYERACREGKKARI